MLERFFILTGELLGLLILLVGHVLDLHVELLDLDSLLVAFLDDKDVFRVQLGELPLLVLQSLLRTVELVGNLRHSLGILSLYGRNFVLVCALYLLELLLSSLLLRLRILLQCLRRRAHDARVLLLHALDREFELLQLFTVAGSVGLEVLNFHAELIDNTPGNHLLSSDPDSCFLVIGLPKEKLEVEQIPEAAALEDLNFDAGQKRLICFCGS